MNLVKQPDFIKCPTMTSSLLSSLQPSRRAFLHRSAQAAMLGGSLGLAGRSVRAAPASERSLALDHTHTHERLELVYASGENYVPQALGSLNHFLRDHYSGEVGQMDPQLFDLLHALRAMGHGDEIALVDGNYPAAEHARRLIRADGIHLMPMLRAVLKIFPVEAAFRASLNNDPAPRGVIHQALDDLCPTSAQDFSLKPLAGEQ